MSDRAKLLPAVATIVAAATLALMGYEMARSAASSIFLAHHPAGRLTEALMLVPLVMIVLTYAVSRLLRRFGPSATYALTLGVSGLVLAGTAFAARRGVPGSAFVLYIFAQAYIVLIVEQSWAFINSLFTTDDGKRWNGDHHRHHDRGLGHRRSAHRPALEANRLGMGRYLRRRPDRRRGRAQPAGLPPGRAGADGRRPAARASGRPLRLGPAALRSHPRPPGPDGGRLPVDLGAL